MIRITAYKDGETLGTGAYEIERVCIGSSDKAHLRVEEEDIAPAHVEIWLDEKRCWTRLLSFQMAWINGEELEGEVELKPGDRLQVSPQVEFTVTYDFPAQAKDEPKKTTEITFKTYSDIVELDDTASTPTAPTTPTKSARRPKGEEEEEKRRFFSIMGLKDMLIVFGMPLVILFLFWWQIWPVIKKIYGWN